MTISYNVQHSPIGAFSSFTLGNFGTRGGFGTQQGRPGECNVFVGWRDTAGSTCLFPFFEPGKDIRRTFGITVDASSTAAFKVLEESEIERSLRYASDSWTSGPLTLKLCSPFFAIPDPSTAREDELKRASCPVVFAKLTIDNRGGSGVLQALFAIDDWQLRDIQGRDSLRGVANRRQYGMACRPSPGVHDFLEFTPQDGFQHAGKRLFRLGKTGGFVVEVAAGEVRELVIALGFHHDGVVTTGLATTYWYRRYFADLEDVLDYALENWAFYEQMTEARDRELEQLELTEAQKFLIAHGAHSYFGSTQWLDRGDRPLWVVNEGEYEMMNTLDLTVDQVFFELANSPWTVKNELEFFLERYSYVDRVRRHTDSQASYTGGISFCHDQGVSNQFSPPGMSSYETRDLPGVCFSFMTQEQLTNWVICAAVYFRATRDRDFLVRHATVLDECLQSLLNRDDPEPSQRTGIMALDSDRTGTGSEITTYDSLDSALGQARNNLYLGTKTWAAYLALRTLFAALDARTAADAAQAAASRCADTIVRHFDPQLGYIPAVFESGNRSAIIPAIEALVYPKIMGLDEVIDANGPFGDLIKILRVHLSTVLRKGVCLFDDGGWKLSSTSDISWVSKIAICQFVARTVLSVEVDPSSDLAHERWQKEGAAYWACTDQFVNGVAVGSRFYPRLVSNFLWVIEGGSA